jgi:hypothetical protein
VIHFPGEKQRSEEMQANLCDEFGLAERTYTFWCLQPKDRWLEASCLSPKVTHTAMLLNMQACRQFRSVIEECKRAEAISGAILARSQFETTLALFFILKPVVRIGTRAVVDKNGRHVPDAFGDPKFAATPGSKNSKKPKRLSREFRATLYVAHGVLQDHYFARDCSTTPGRKRFGLMYQKKLSSTVLVNTETALGPEWSSILRGRSGYSGLGVAGLAKLLHKKLEFWYRTVYHLQSRAVHSLDSMNACRRLDNRSIGAAVFSEEGEGRLVLYSATGLFLLHLILLQKYIGFGEEVELELESFAAQHRQIYGAVPASDSREV